MFGVLYFVFGVSKKLKRAIVEAAFSRDLQSHRIAAGCRSNIKIESGSHKFKDDDCARGPTSPGRLHQLPAGDVDGLPRHV